MITTTRLSERKNTERVMPPIISAMPLRPTKDRARFTQNKSADSGSTLSESAHQTRSNTADGLEASF
jgi:hypothetical protein